MNTRFSAARTSLHCWLRTTLHWHDIRQGRRGRVVADSNLIHRSTTGDTKRPYISRAIRSEQGRASMTPQERQMIDDLFDRLSKLEGAPRDPEAVAAIAQGSRKAPNAVYALVQTVLLQDEALKRANHRIQELEQAPAGEQNQSGGSVPNVPPPVPSRPVWNSGQVLQQSQSPGHYDQGPYDQGPYGQGSYGQGSYGQGYGQGPSGQPYGASQSPFGGGG